jgi:hypothetical protein
VLYVPDDADDGAWRVAALHVDDDAFANGVFAGPQHLGRRLADDDFSVSFEGFAAIEGTSADERDPESLEEVRLDERDIHARLLRDGEDAAVLDLHADASDDARERKEAVRAGGAHAEDRSNRVYDAGEERGLLFILPVAEVPRVVRRAFALGLASR